jgi:hypothetical protein
MEMSSQSPTKFPTASEVPMSVETRVDALISEFDHWFRNKGNDPLVRSEIAAIKTFCWFLINVRDRSTIPVVEDKEPSNAPPSDG